VPAIATFGRCHCPGLEKRAHPPQGPVEDTEFTERVGDAVGLLSICTGYFRCFWVGGSFACFDRGLLVLYIRPLGLFLELFGGPRWLASRGKRGGDGWAFLLYSMEGCLF
jgi:hypothetical protein